MQTFNSFNNLIETEQSVENDEFAAVSASDSLTNNVIPPVTPSQPSSNLPPHIPQWRQSLTGRVETLEKDMATVKTNMATKQDIRELKALITGQKSQAPQQNPPPVTW